MSMHKFIYFCVRRLACRTLRPDGLLDVANMLFWGVEAGVLGAN